jgi:hypothetical protein
MSADEAAALLPTVTPRRVCVMCRAVDPPTRPGMIGPDAVELHDCASGRTGRVDEEVGRLAPEVVARALRAVVALHARAAGAEDAADRCFALGRAAGELAAAGRAAARKVGGDDFAELRAAWVDGAEAARGQRREEGGDHPGSMERAP